jgi:hypothetical protein
MVIRPEGEIARPFLSLHWMIYWPAIAVLFIVPLWFGQLSTIVPCRRTGPGYTYGHVRMPRR